MQRLIFIVLFAGIFFGRSTAQTPFHINYDIKDGLPSSEVYDIEIDEQGIVWLTTDRGVCTFDGYKFATYTTQDGLSNNTNFEIIKGKDGRFWFTGFNGGLSYYKDGIFQVFDKNDQLEKLGNGRWIVNLIESENHLYFTKVKYRDIYFSMSLQTGEVTTHEIKTPKSLIAEEKHGEYFKVNIGSDKLMYNDSTTFLTSNLILKSSGLELAIGMDNLYVINKEQIIAIPEFVNVRVDYLYEDRFQHVWIGTNRGLYLYRHGDLNQKPEVYFKNRAIASIKEDRDGNYWIASLESGVFVVPSFDIKKYDIPNCNENYLFLKNMGGQMYVGTSRDYSYLLTFKNDEILADSLESPVNYNRLYANLIEYLDRDFSTISNQYQPLESIDGFHLPIIRMNNGKYLSCNVTGYDLYIKSFPTFIKMRKEDNLLAEKRINKVVKYGAEHLLIGSMKGTYIVHQDSMFMERELIKNSPLLDIRISDILPVTQDQVWIATLGNGLICYTPDTLLQFTETQGLQSDLINNLALQGDSILWVGTNKGLNKIELSVKNGIQFVENISGFTTNDGLFSNYINYIELIGDQVFLALNNGINYFTAQDLKKEILPPEVFLEAAQTLNDDQAIAENQRLKSNQNDVVFAFKGISFNRPLTKPFYKYKLQGGTEKEDWFYTNERSARFTNLAAGDYQFLVSARNKNDVWSVEPAMLSFSIAQHYSSTWWFKLIMTAGGLSLFAFIWWSRSSSMRQEQKLKEAHFRTKDAELSALRNQMNPHFVHNSLNSIQNYIFKNDIENANYYLSQFSMLMRNSLEFSKLKNISLEEEVKFLTMYMELEQLRFPNKFEFKLIVDEEIPQDLYFIPPLLLQPILENSVKYAFNKGKQADGLIEVIIKEEIPGNSLSVIIQDNGSGITDALDVNRKKSNYRSLGLGIVKNRIELLNIDKKNPICTFAFENRNDTKGLRTIFILPITVKEND